MASDVGERTSASPHSGGASPLGPVALTIRTLGELMITAGVLCLLLVAYQLYWTDLLNSRTQHRLHEQFQQAIADAPKVSTAVIDQTGGVDVKTLPIGDNVGEVFIPRLGRNYKPIIVEGTDEQQLMLGPGHYAGTALPGQVGNFAVAGHRTTYGKPFNRLAEVRAGDHVVIRTRSAWVTYLVTGETIIPSTDDDGYVIQPSPPAIGDQQSSTRLLTFTTCNPEYSASQRLILRGVWQQTDPSRPGFVPAALQPGVT